MPNRLIEFSVNAVTSGIDAIGEVTIRIEADAKVFNGHGADTDILVASAQAYINALNRMLAGLGKDWSAKPEAQAIVHAPPSEG